MARLVSRMLLLVLALVPGLGGCHQQEVHATPTTLTAMTFNIRYGTARDGENAWDRRNGMVFQTVRDADPDVVGLQEALKFQVDEIISELPGYAAVFVGRDDGKSR